MRFFFGDGEKDVISSVRPVEDFGDEVCRQNLK